MQMQPVRRKWNILGSMLAIEQVRVCQAMLNRGAGFILTIRLSLFLVLVIALAAAQFQLDEGQDGIKITEAQKRV
jgi:hypothetical protein